MHSCENAKTILLVEDEAIIAMSERLTLESLGYRVMTAGTGERAVELADSAPEIDLILMDIDLGAGIDGTQAAEIILRSRDLPIVFLSSHTDPEVVEKTEKITSYGYFVKDCGTTVLSTSLKMAFRLFESRKLFKDTFDHSINGVCVHRFLRDEADRPYDCLYLQVNAAFETHTGLNSSRLIGKTIRDIYPSGEADAVIALYAEIVAGRKAERQEIYFAPTQSWFELSVFPTRDDEFSVVLQNITERIRGQEALAAEKERLRVTLQSVGDAVIATDIDGKVVLLNAVAQALTGWTQDAAVGRPMAEIFQIVHALTREVCANPVDRVLREGVVLGLANHTVLISTDGSEYQIADSAAPIKDSTGSVIGVVLVFRDVTEAYALERALHESEREMKRAQKMAKLGSWSFDLDSETVTASEETRRLYGLDGAPLSVEQVQTVPLPQHRANLDGALRALVETGEPYDIEYRIRRPSDDALRHIHSIAEYDADRNVVTGTIQDITARKEAEETLRRERARFSMITETSPVGIVTVDADGSITYANPAAERILGLTRDEITSRTYDAPAWRHTTLDGGPFPDEEQPFYLVKTTGQPVYDVQHAIVWPDGGRVVLSVNGSPMKDEDGSFRGMVATIEDITKRTLAEESVSLLLAEKNLLLKEVQHRIKNTLSTMVSLLSMQAETTHDPGAAGALTDARNRLQSMQVLYDQLYRSETYNTGSVRDYLTQLVDRAFRLFPKRENVKLATAFDEGLSLDAKRLSAVGIIVNELVTNAMKHAFRDGRCGRLSVSANRREDNVIIIVEDDGPGRLETSSVDSPTSFGLTMVTALSGQLGGTIRIEGDGGTRAILQFPV